MHRLTRNYREAFNALRMHDTSTYGCLQQRTRIVVFNGTWGRLEVTDIASSTVCHHSANREDNRKGGWSNRETKLQVINFLPDLYMIKFRMKEDEVIYLLREGDSSRPVCILLSAGLARTISYPTPHVGATAADCEPRSGHLISCANTKTSNTHDLHINRLWLGGKATWTKDLSSITDDGTE